MLRGRSGLAHSLERRVLVALQSVRSERRDFLFGLRFFAQRWMGHGMQWITDGLPDWGKLYGCIDPYSGSRDTEN